MIRARAFAAVMGIIAIWPPGLPAAQAHAVIVESSPRHEESAPAPKRLVLRFNGRIEKKLCSVQLIGPRSQTVALLRQEPDTPPDTIAYPLPVLEPGAYRARWRVMSADGHVTEGAVVFTVVPREPIRSP